jgi:hypothetical protein
MAFFYWGIDGMRLIENQNIPICRPITGKRYQKIPKKFNHKWEYGSAVELKSVTDKGGIAHLHLRAKQILPKGTPYQLRLQKDFTSFDDKGNNVAFRFLAAWYYCPWFIVDKSEKTLSTKRWTFSIPKNIWIRGMFKA